MPKYRKRHLNKKFRYISTAAISYLEFSIAKNLTYFGAGGTSFVLEDALGNKIRLVYTSTHHTSSPAFGGYFDSSDTLQPRYLNGDINSPSTALFEEGKEFFGYGWNQQSDDIISYYEIGAAVKIFYGDISSMLTSSDIGEVTTAVTELVRRSAVAINYAQEIKITAQQESQNTLKLSQIVEGVQGNTDVFRGFNESLNDEGAFYGILTADIITNNFSGGLVQTITYFEPKSGILSKAFKKVLRDNNNQSSSTPLNALTNRISFNEEFSGFNDLKTQLFLKDQSNIDARTGVKLKEIDIVDNVATDYLIYSSQDVSNIDTSGKVISLGLEKSLLSKTSIFDKSNILEINNIDKDLLTQKYNIIEKENYETSFKSFNDNSAINSIDNSLSSFNDSSLFDDENIFTQKQLTFSLDFNSNDNSKDAILINTDMYKSVDLGEGGFHSYVPQQFNFTNSGTISTPNCLQTAYWNDIDKEWNYLDFSKYNIAEDKTGFIFPMNIVSSSALDIDEIDNRLDFVSNKNICFSPAYRPINFEDENINVNKFSQVTNSYGFPTKYNWQPHNNHTIDLSKYISQDFYVEKVIIKGNLSIEAEKVKLNGNLKLSDSSTEYSSAADFSTILEGRDAYDTNYISSGLNFFIIKESDKSADLNFPKLVSYFEGNNIVSDPAKDILETSESNQGLLKLLNNSEYIYTNSSYELFQRIIDNKITALNDFYKEETLYLKDNSFEVDLYNKFFKLEKEENNSLNIHMSIHNLQQSFSEDNNNLNSNITDFDIFTASDHYQISEIFLQDKAHLKPNKKRELLTFSNTLFVNSQNDIYNLKSFKDATRSSYIVSNETNNDYISISNRDFEIHDNIKNTISKNYIDKSIYTLKSTVDPDASVFNILEGKTENIETGEILKQSNEDKSIVNDIAYVDQNNLIFDSKKDLYNSKINASILKPNDRLIFGINAYNNGNLISSITKLHDSLTITLIGKEVSQEAHKNNYSKAISKTLFQKNNTKYKNIKLPGFEANFSNTNVDKKTFSLIKKEKLIKDTVWPSVTSIFRYFNKSSVQSVLNNFYPSGGIIFGRTKDYYLSNDVFSPEEISSDINLSRVLTLQEWKNINIFTDLVKADRYIDVISLDKKVGSFLNYDGNGYDGNTIKNYVTSKTYSNVNRRFNIDYTNFSSYTTSNIVNQGKQNDYSPLWEQINSQNAYYNQTIYGKPLYFNKNNAYQNILESNFNINDHVNSTKNFTGYLTLQKPRIFNKWCLVPLVESVIDGNNPESGSSKIVALLRSIALYCYNLNRDEYFNYLGFNTVKRDDSFKDENDNNPSVFYYMYEFKIKLPTKLGRLYKEFITLITVKSDLEDLSIGTQEIEDINVVIPLEYYETGEFGYNMNIDDRQPRLSSSSILEIDDSELYEKIYNLNNQGINNYSLFNCLHSKYYDFNTDFSVEFFQSSFIESYMFYAQQFHKFWQTTEDFISALDTKLYNNQVQNFANSLPSGITNHIGNVEFYKNYIAFEYNNLNIDTSFKRLKPNVSLSGSAGSYFINNNTFSNVNNSLVTESIIDNYIDKKNKEDEVIKHIFISNELVPNFGIDLITSLIQNYLYKNQSFNDAVSSQIIDIIKNIDYTSDDSQANRKIKQYFNFSFNKKSKSNNQSQSLESYEKVYRYKKENIESIFKIKDNFYNLNFEDPTPTTLSSDLYLKENKVIDLLSFNNSYFTTKKDIPGIYDVIMDIDENLELSTYKLEDPVKISYNKNNNINEPVNYVNIDFNRLQYDYKKIRQQSEFVFRGLPLIDLSNYADTYSSEITPDEKSKCVMYGISRELGFAIKKIDKFKYGILTPYNHKNKYYLCNLNNNKQLNKLAGTHNYAYLDLSVNNTVYPVIKNFINSSFVYYTDTTINNADLESYNTDKHSRLTSGFVDS